MVNMLKLEAQAVAGRVYIDGNVRNGTFIGYNGVEFFFFFLRS